MERLAGNLDRALEHLDAARPLLEQGDPNERALERRERGQCEAARGNTDLALELLHEARLLFGQTQNRVQAAATLMLLGDILQRIGDTARAAALCAESMVLSRDNGDRLQLARALEGLAGVAATTGRPELAARLLGAAEALRLAIQGPLWPSERASYDQHLAATRAALDQTEFAASWAAGRALTLEQAIAFALEASASG